MDSTGVYVGVSYSEYAQLVAAQTSSVSTYPATGGSLSVAAGIVSPVLLLRSGVCIASSVKWSFAAVTSIITRAQI